MLFIYQAVHSQQPWCPVILFFTTQMNLQSFFYFVNDEVPFQGFSRAVLIGKQCKGKYAHLYKLSGYQRRFLGWSWSTPLLEAVAKEVIGLSAAVVKSSRLQLAAGVVDRDAESSEAGLGARGRGPESWGSLAGFSSKAGLGQWLGEKTIHQCASLSWRI